MMLPIILVINLFTKDNLWDSIIFAITIAVGITPEMLPVIVTTTMAKGAVEMSKQKTIVKRLSAIQTFGQMDILCTDKTGTLTEDEIVLEKYMNVNGEEDQRILKHAFLNSYFQTGLKNLIDIAIINRADKEKPFSYPVVPKGKARIRTQVCANHTKEDIDFVVKCFCEVREEMK